MINLRLTVFLGILFSFKIYAAQIPEPSIDNSPYSVNHYTDENGLPQNSIKAMLQDPEGFVWFITESGLVRFDGRNFSVFNKSSLPIASSSFYTVQPGIDKNAGKFYAISANSEVIRIVNNTVSVDSQYYTDLRRKIPIIDDPETLLYTGTPNYLWDVSLERSRNYVILLSPRKNTYCVLRKGDITFFAGRRQLRKIKYGKYQFNEFFGFDGKLYHCLPDGQIASLELTAIKKVCLTGDILKDPSFRPGKKNFTVFANHLTGQAFVLLNQNFYLLTSEPGKKLNTRLILGGFNFQKNHIVTILYDSLSQRLFLGSLTKGLFMFSQKRFQPVQVNEEPMANVIYAQSFENDKLKFLSNGNLLMVSAPRRDFQQRGVLHPPIIKTKAGRQLDESSILTDTMGRNWSVAREHIRVFDKAGTKMLFDWKLRNRISTIFQGHGGRIWIGLYRQGLAFLDPYDPAPKPTFFIRNSMPGIRYILQSDAHHLWLGSEKGLFSLDTRSQKLVLIPGTEKLLVRSMLITHYGGNNMLLFFSTYDDGIFLYHNNKLTSFPLDADRRLATAHCLIEDSKGFLWVTTNRGLFQVAKRDLVQYAERPGKSAAPFYLHYAKADGFASNEFNGGCQPCAVKMSDGTVSLPSMEGLVWFKPEKIRAETPNKRIFVDWLRVMGRPTPFNDSTIHLPANPKQIALRISTPYFGSANNLQLYYSLTQEHEPSASWIKLNPDEPIVYFSELQSGTHQLYIKKYNGFGLNNYSLKSIKIIVAPHWYETTWFLMLCISVIALLLHVYSRMRNKILRSKNIKLENKISMRTSDLRTTLSVLESSEKELNRQAFIQARLLASITHDVRSPLAYLGMLTESIEKLVLKQDFATVAEICRDLSKSVARMNSFLDNLLAYTKSQISEQNKTEKIALHSIVREKKELFLLHIRQRGSVIINEVPDTCYVYSNANLLKIIIHNLIDNANKYTYQGVIRISTVRRPDGLHLIISDNGPGFPKAVLEWLNMPDAERETKANARKEKVNGLGLLIVKDLAKIIKVRLSVVNEKGAHVHLIFQESSDLDENASSLIQ